MVENLKDAGFELVVWNRTREKADGLDLSIAASPRDLGARTRTVITMVADDDAVREVVLGEDGVLDGMESGGLVIDCSTTSIECKKEVAAALKVKGIAFVEAPVFGSNVPARQGELAMAVGGSDESVERAKPLLDAIGKGFHHMGPVGSAAAMKLAGNMMGAGATALLANALVLGKAYGLDTTQMLDVIDDTGFAAPMYRRRGTQMLDGAFDPGWPVRLVLKDVRLASEAGKDVGVPLRTAQGVIADYQAAVEAGAGDRDASAVVQAIGEVS
jgi:3-hydroxyisobutyrate dehydrogenase-like beta-hydroxyacid dehydrogenase